MSHFDRIIAVVVVVLLAAIGVTVLLGDHVGVQVESAGPTGSAASTARILLRFSEAMDWDSVIAHLSIEPALEGAFQHSGRSLRFIPAQALAPGDAYTVTLQAGATSETGRQVLDEIDFSFDVRAPRVAYLSPADVVPQNVWLAAPDDLASAQQLSFSPQGILNFDVSPDGTQLALAERGLSGTSNIKLLDLDTGDLVQVTNCFDSDCNTPVWRPDGTMIAYNRVDLNSDVPELGVSATRVWLVDLTTTPPSERPLFEDNQILGYGPQWSADGRYITVFDNNNRAILVYDMTETTLSMVPSQSGGDIALSPDGRRLAFPRLIFEEDSGTTRSILQMADLDASNVADLYPEDEPVDDSQSAWHPDGRRLVIARRYTDDRARALFAALVRRFAQHVRRAGAEPLLLILPQPIDLDQRDRDQSSYGPLLAELESEIAVVDMTDRFHAHPNRDWLFVDGPLGPHVSPAGNQIIADAIAAASQRVAPREHQAPITAYPPRSQAGGR